MEENQELLEALNGIRAELQLLNKTVAALAAQQGRAPHAPSAPSAGRPAPSGGRSASFSSGRPSSSRPPAGRGATGGGYKRTASPSEDGEATGYGAEMASRFPKKRGSARPSNKPPAKKGGGYPKKPR